MIEGSDVALPMEDGSVANGFVVTRVVSASSPEEASQIAEEIVASELAAGRVGPGASSAVLSTSEIEKVRFFDRFRDKTTGYIFYFK